MTPEESPKKTRSRAAAAAAAATPAEAPKKTRKKAAPAEAVEAPAPTEAPKRRAKAKKSEEAPAQLALTPAPAPKAERKSAPAAAPPPPPPPAPVVVAAPPPPPAPVVVAAPPPVASAPAPSQQSSAPAPSSGGEQPSPQSGAIAAPGGQPQDQSRHQRQERFRPRHERHGGQNQQNRGQQHGGQQHGGGQPHGAQQHGGGQHTQPQGQGGQSQQGGQPQQGQPQQGQPHQGGQPQQGQGGQQFPGGQPGQGHGRRRRRRGRGGGGGGGQPGQPGQQGGQPQQQGGQPHQQPNQNFEAQFQPVSGILELDERGFGRLRKLNFQASENDPDVPKQIVDRCHLRAGSLINGSSLMRNGRPQIQRVDLVDGLTLDEASSRISFMNLTSVDPDRRIILETTTGELLTRAIDVIAPIGFGQRALIVAPPKTGKTIILQKMAKAILTNHPKAKLMVLLIDERPEEVTDFKRSIGADVYASSSDRPAHEHLRIAEMVAERARRLVEAGDDVVVLLDSITRLARAYNKEIESSGRTMSGGVDSRALERPKRLFGAARNTEEAGSLTIIGTALIDTGSRMDEVIFEEFKGTGNMEIVLDRQLAERRLFPAINVNSSGTRKEEKLFSVKENEKIRKLRAYLSALRPVEAMEKLLGRLRDFRSNAEFFDAI